MSKTWCRIFAITSSTVNQILSLLETVMNYLTNSNELSTKQI